MKSGLEKEKKHGMSDGVAADEGGGGSSALDVYGGSSRSSEESVVRRRVGRSELPSPRDRGQGV